MNSFDSRAIGVYARVTGTALMICGFVALGVLCARVLMSRGAPLWQSAGVLLLCLLFGLFSAGRELYRLAKEAKKERSQ